MVNYYKIFFSTICLHIIMSYLGSSRNLPPQPSAIKGMPHHTPLSLEALRAHTAIHGKNLN